MDRIRRSRDTLPEQTTRSISQTLSRRKLRRIMWILLLTSKKVRLKSSRRVPSDLF
jgi:hypothetical protein